MHRRLLPFVALIAAGTASLAAAAPDDVFLDPAKAGPDFRVQGEYVGMAAGQKVGAQVIALGNGTFEAVFLSGGLPGDGWDGKTASRVPGRTAGEVTSFPAETGWRGTIRGEAFSVESGGGAGELRRTARRSPTEGAAAPAGARVLFDGKGIDAWQGGKMTAEGLLECGARTKESFRDFTLHLEFRVPFKPEARGQSRGNSGVYIFNRYEVQILDSFGLEGKVNECGAVYRQKAPTLNMAYPPLAWQTYDIDFQSPRFDESGKKVSNAVITVRHNGVVVHDRYELTGPTGGGQRIGETGSGGPIQIQNHRNPVHLRHVWIVPRG